MKNSSILLESASILALAIVLGTAAHNFRPDQKQRIPYVGNYLNVFETKPYDKKEELPPPIRIEPPGSGGGNQIEIKPPVTEPLAKLDPKNLPPGVREIPAEEAIAEYDDGTPFLDARRTRYFEESRIPGARPMSVWEADLDQKISALPEEIDYAQPLVIYCSSGDCADSHMLAEKLSVAGYKDIRVFLGGFPEWVKRNRPVEKGPPAVRTEEEAK